MSASRSNGESSRSLTSSDGRPARAVALDHLARDAQPGRDARAAAERRPTRALEEAEAAASAPRRRARRVGGGSKKRQQRPQLVAARPRAGTSRRRCRSRRRAPTGCRRLGDRPQDAREAPVPVRVDARREVEHDDPAAARRRSSCSAGRGAPPREQDARAERERAPHASASRSERRPPRRAPRAPARRRVGSPARAVRADHARLPSSRRRTSARASSTSTALGGPATTRARARGRRARRGRGRRARARAAREALPALGRVAVERGLAGELRARARAASPAPRASSSSTALDARRWRSSREQPDAEQREQRARRRGAPREHAGRARDGHRRQRRRVGAPALGAIDVHRHASRHLERRPVDDRGAPALRRRGTGRRRPRPAARSPRGRPSGAQSWSRQRSVKRYRKRTRRASPVALDLALARRARTASKSARARTRVRIDERPGSTTNRPRRRTGSPKSATAGSIAASTTATEARGAARRRCRPVPRRAARARCRAPTIASAATTASSDERPPHRQPLPCSNSRLVGPLHERGEDVLAAARREQDRLDPERAELVEQRVAPPLVRAAALLRLAALQADEPHPPVRAGERDDEPSTGGKLCSQIGSWITTGTTSQRCSTTRSQTSRGAADEEVGEDEEEAPARDRAAVPARGSRARA